MMLNKMHYLSSTLLLLCLLPCRLVHGFFPSQCTRRYGHFVEPSTEAHQFHHRCRVKAFSARATVSTIEDATRILADWDRLFNPDSKASLVGEDEDAMRAQLPDAIRLLNDVARDERTQDSTKGRCMLGICASSAEEGLSALKRWVTALFLPRGLLHGMDKEGVPLEIEGGVYIKYNTGGALTFADIRRSGVGFEALWRPGDALLEPYEGIYRGVYFQVELADGVFRQYLVPLDVFL